MNVFDEFSRGDVMAFLARSGSGGSGPPNIVRVFT